MDLTTFTSLFSGSVYKPLSQHRQVVLDALVLLSRQLQSRLTTDQQWHKRAKWLVDFPPAVEKLGQEILARLNQPTLTAQPRGLVLSLLQTQNNLAHLICRLAERLTYRTPKLTGDLQCSEERLNQHFASVVNSLRYGVSKQDGLGMVVFRKQRSQALLEVNQEVTIAVDELQEIISAFKGEVFQSEGELDPLDMALLLLSLEDMDDLTLWIRSMVIHMHQL
ncbi:hypothetical protein [Endozoicomonas sp. SCSIO W0465]|uniref:hypothetical protein n=1 Tax=Endozoicomonas sp. SCSIO W0465 TaxID=2918516 RepID=UPI0020763C61|nr:hypothetical protein [Endozoicomonas sp. SCSIO W0465]USE36623.1 hypothetical protein MJO57_32225 [Endozoicomonas sp. SCSIO W0465]